MSVCLAVLLILPSCNVLAFRVAHSACKEDEEEKEKDDIASSSSSTSSSTTTLIRSVGLRRNGDRDRIMGEPKETGNVMTRGRRINDVTGRITSVVRVRRLSSLFYNIIIIIIRVPSSISVSGGCRVMRRHLPRKKILLIFIIIIIGLFARRNVNKLGGRK